MAEGNRNTLPPKSLEENSASLSDGNQTEPAIAETLRPDVPDKELMQASGQPRLSVQSAPLRIISERKLQANRANATKSTGPRTARGNAWSRRNAVKHGLSSTAVLFRPDGTPIDPELQAVWEDLRETYGPDDARRGTLLQTVVTEWSHQRQAAELEGRCFQNALDDSRSVLSLRTLQRYRTASQRALLKSLARLRNLAPATSPTE